MEYNIELLARTEECLGARVKFRRERERCKRFTYGDQWGDLERVEGAYITEEAHLRRQGNVSLTNNLIRRLVRNVLGVYRNQWAVPRCEARDIRERPEVETLQSLLEYYMELNRMEEVYARTMEEFLISGLAVHRKWYGRRGGRTDCWTDFVSPDAFFTDSEARDFRSWDVSLVGEVREMDFATVCASFAKSGSDFERLRALYPSQERRCRVTEVWTREYRGLYRCHDRYTGRCFDVGPGEFAELVETPNLDRCRGGLPLIESRWLMEEEWHYHFLSPEGAVIDEGVSPYDHRRHPYVFKAYPFIDGEIHSFVSDIIEQQKLTNRLISMYDWALRCAAKGVLLFPEGALPTGADINDIAEEWSRFNGVIVFKPKPGVPLPQQVSTNATNIGIIELLEIQMKMMEDISGVNGALQGKLDNTSMSGTLYNQQTRNSMTALADLLKSFNGFVADATAVDLSNIRQFYGSEKIRAIAGEDAVSGLRRRRHFGDTPSDIVVSL